MQSAVIDVRNKADGVLYRASIIEKRKPMRLFNSAGKTTLEFIPYIETAVARGRSIISITFFPILTIYYPAVPPNALNLSLEQFCAVVRDILSGCPIPVILQGKTDANLDAISALAGVEIGFGYSRHKFTRRRCRNILLMDEE